MSCMAARASRIIGLVLFKLSPEAVRWHCTGRQCMPDCFLLQTGSLAARCVLLHDMSLPWQASLTTG